MREMGYVNCTPSNVDEFDDYEVQSALLMYEIEHDPQLEKARKQVAANEARMSRMQNKGGSHLSLVH